MGLNHQFLQIHEKSLAPSTNGGPGYEAIVMVGYDNASERYVAHWMDIYGGRFSETLGFGTRSGDQIEFVLEYPDGPFRTTFRWLADCLWPEVGGPYFHGHSVYAIACHGGG